MKQIKFFLGVVLLAITLTNCSSYSDTTLTLTIKDEIGNPLSDASAKLYASSTDWANNTNQVGSTQISDASGKVTFTGLSDKKYYWWVEKDCQNNANGAITTTDVLTKGKTNTVDAILSKTGKIIFTNTSTNPYKVYINGEAKFDMDGGTTRTVSYLKEGNYTLRVLQLSGYVLYPTDKTYTGDVKCGQSSALTFP